MFHRRRRSRSHVPSGYYRFEDSCRRTLQGHGEGDFIRLRDEYGNVWHGQADRQPDDSIRFRFRDSQGKAISGMSDGYGIILRDDNGRIWRGFLE